MLQFPSWARVKKRERKEKLDSQGCQPSVLVRIDHNGLIAPGAPTQVAIEEIMALVPASNDDPGAATWGRNRKIIEWLDRLAEPGASRDAATEAAAALRATLAQSIEPGLLEPDLPLKPSETLIPTMPQRLEDSMAQDMRLASPPADDLPQQDDWQSIFTLCGYGAKEFASAQADLPLTAAEIDHFLRNHRNTENYVSRDFLISRSDLPSPLAELYGLYLHRARVDAEAALFVAQATGSTRVARIMSDLLAIGGFSNGLEYISHAGVTYSVPAALDTSAVIDAANDEAAHRMALDAAHPTHLLKLTPDDIAGLAADLADRHTLAPCDFLDKANLLAEARQDVARLPVSQRFATALIERDLPQRLDWVARIGRAYNRLLKAWVAGLPEIKSLRT